MSTYRSFLWSRKAGLVERALQPAPIDGEALLARISQMGKIAVRLRGLRAPSAQPRLLSPEKMRAKAQLHLARAERLILALNDPGLAAQAAELRGQLK